MGWKPYEQNLLHLLKEKWSKRSKDLWIGGTKRDCRKFCKTCDLNILQNLSWPQISQRKRKL